MLFTIEMGGEILCPKCKNIFGKEAMWAYENGICPSCGFKEEVENELDWDEAEKQLKTFESLYAEIGSIGVFGMCVMRELRDSFNEGERTKELYEAIMEIE